MVWHTDTEDIVAHVDEVDVHLVADGRGATANYSNDDDDDDDALLLAHMAQESAADDPFGLALDKEEDGSDEGHADPAEREGVLWLSNDC